MRRIILAVAGTVAGLVALLSFRSHVPSSAAVASTGTSGGSGTASGPGGGSGAGAGAGAPQPAATAALTAGERAVNGKVANTAYGPVQVQVVVKKHKIVNVNILQQPTTTAEDLQIGHFSFPKLISETLMAQNARIDAVSGASYTSAGYIKSLQSALDKGA